MAIAVRIPKEIKEYKEKIMFGLTGRQLISVGVALGVCVPTYFLAKNHVNEELLAWALMTTATVLVGYGFFKYNGMSFERFIGVFFDFYFLLPRKRKYVSENAFMQWQEEAEQQEVKIKSKRLAYQASLERAFLIAEAVQEGNESFNVSDAKLLTVSTSDTGGGGKKPKKEKIPKAKKDDKNDIQTMVQSIQAKQAENPRYVMSRKEFDTMREWLKRQEELRRKEITAGKKKLGNQSKTMEKMRRRAKTVLPKTVQQSIPYISDYDEGLFEVGANKYSKMYRINDINYFLSHEEEQIKVFVKYGEFLNYFSDDMQVAVCIDNRIVSVNELESKVLYPLAQDTLDRHRQEFNNILRRQIAGGKNDIQVEKYITVTVESESAIEAMLRFHKIDAEVIANLRKIGSNGEVLSTEQRLEIYHDKFRKGREGEFKIDFEFLKSQGISSKDYIAPMSFDFGRDEFRIDNEYYRCLFISNLPASLADDFIAQLVDNDFPVTTTMTIQPVAQDKAMRIVNKQLTGMQANKIEAEKRALRAGYNPDTINHNLKQSLTQAEELLDDMMNKNQKMFFVSITCMVHGETKEELENHVKILQSKARKYTCQLHSLTFQQEEAMKLTLPFGYCTKNVMVNRTLTTESTSIFMPFSNQELFQPNGFYYGLNQISRNLILCDRFSMMTPSGFILGFPGSGKSFATKREMINVILRDNMSNVLIIDPENEYGDFARAFNGEVLKISSDTVNHINPMDMPMDYGLDEDDNSETTPMNIKKRKAIKKKSEYIISIVERMISAGSAGDDSEMSAQQKTIIDRCVVRCYEKYLKHDFDEHYLPTLVELQKEFDKERGSEDGAKIAEGVEYYTKGSMDIFSHKTNIDINNRLVVFNVRDLGDQVRQIALLIVFDFIWSRMVSNKNKVVNTYCYCDEIHVMFDFWYSAFFLKQLFKRGRKYGLCITGITQNVEDILASKMGRGMIKNSKFIMMLNQSSDDLEILAEMLKISDAQRNYVEMANPGSGLLFADGVIVPFVDQFPKESYLYTLISTKFGEKTKEEVDSMIKEIAKDGIKEAV